MRTSNVTNHPRGPKIEFCYISFYGDLVRMSRGSSVSIVTRLRTGRLGFDSWQDLGLFSLLRRLQTGSGAHPASYSMGIGDSLPGGKTFGA
jgi:hypothetical protein